MDLLIAINTRKGKLLITNSTSQYLQPKEKPSGQLASPISFQNNNNEKNQTQITYIHTQQPIGVCFVHTLMTTRDILYSSEPWSNSIGSEPIIISNAGALSLHSAEAFDWRAPLLNYDVNSQSQFGRRRYQGLTFSEARDQLRLVFHHCNHTSRVEARCVCVCVQCVWICVHFYCPDWHSPARPARVPLSDKVAFCLCFEFRWIPC